MIRWMIATTDRLLPIVAAGLVWLAVASEAFAQSSDDEAGWHEGAEFAFSCFLVAIAVIIVCKQSKRADKPKKPEEEV